jgi:GDP-L-fucose synthase
MNRDSRIFVAGHQGLVGSAICRRLHTLGYSNVLTQSRQDLNLTEQGAVTNFFDAVRPQYVFLAAARVGGILANSRHPADFIRDNLLIQTNVIHAAYKSGVRKLVFLGSSCIYPKFATQPIKEECLLTGSLEPTNQWYAVAKIAGIKMCQAYRRQYGFDAISLMPTNLYGPGDNFDLETSHVLPALLRKFHEAKIRNAPEVVVWGTGIPKREFLYVDDLADASIFLAINYSNEEIINVGVGKDVSIAELAKAISKEVDYLGATVYDRTKPDGTPQKLLDVSRLHELGWQAQTSLSQGIRETYRWFLTNPPRTSPPARSS